MSLGHQSRTLLKKVWTKQTTIFVFSKTIFDFSKKVWKNKQTEKVWKNKQNLKKQKWQFEKTNKVWKKQNDCFYKKSLKKKNKQTEKVWKNKQSLKKKNNSLFFSTSLSGGILVLFRDKLYLICDGEDELQMFLKIQDFFEISNFFWKFKISLKFQVFFEISSFVWKFKLSFKNSRFLCQAGLSIENHNGKSGLQSPSWPGSQKCLLGNTKATVIWFLDWWIDRWAQKSCGGKKLAKFLLLLGPRQV